MKKSVIWTINQLESKAVVIKQATPLLSKRLIDIESQCRAKAQYSRIEYIEVVGIPKSVSNNNVEYKVLTVFQEIGSELSPRGMSSTQEK